jgi:two-component system response regulator FixJ
VDRSEVYLIDDDDSVRRSLGLLLSTAGLASRPYDNALTFMRDCDDLAPGCIVTDMQMPGMDGLALLRQLKARNVPHPVLVITGHGRIPRVVEAFNAGAFDYLEKPLDDDTVLAAVRAALKADKEASRRRALENDRRTTFETLTLREHQVLDGLVEGRSNKVIARDLGISPRTVEAHRATMMVKSGVQSLPALVRMVMSLDERTDVSADAGESLRLAR